MNIPILPIIQVVAGILTIVVTAHAFLRVIREGWKNGRKGFLLETAAALGVGAILLVVASALLTPRASPTPTPTNPPHNPREYPSPPANPKPGPESKPQAKVQILAQKPGLVQQTEEVEISYRNITAQYHLWLLIWGKDPNKYWPLGDCDEASGRCYSVIQGATRLNDGFHWRSRYKVAVFPDAANRYCLELIVVDAKEDELLSHLFKDEYHNIDHPFDGVTTKEHSINHQGPRNSVEVWTAGALMDSEPACPAPSNSN